MEIKKIVITGGPCAGKTTALSWIQNKITALGYTVLFVPETATELITGGVAPWTCGTNLDYQMIQMELQLYKEKAFERAAATMPKDKILVVCDRGAMDNRAYMTEEEFKQVQKAIGKTEVELRDSYDAVFHMVSAANGAIDFYTTENNLARHESPEDAIDLDNRLIAAWTGHPHFRVINNSTSFETKLKNLIKEITSFLGTTVPLEMKRKFLIEYPDIEWLESLPYCHKVEIKQTYLLAPEGEEVRIRKRGENGSYLFFLKSKKPKTATERIVIEKRLRKGEYEMLLNQADPKLNPIRKTRYCLTWHSRYYEVDVYPFWKDRAIMEIELNSADEVVDIPDGLKVIRDVTEEAEYKNASLARKIPA